MSEEEYELWLDKDLKRADFLKTKKGVRMTNEEAIAYGRRVIDLGLNDETQAFCELAIKALEQQSHSWIPVSKGLPKSGENVLFRTKDCTVFEGRYFNYIGSDRQWYSSRYDKFEYNYYVVAWMPAEPYKYESEE